MLTRAEASVRGRADAEVHHAEWQPTIAEAPKGNERLDERGRRAPTTTAVKQTVRQLADLL